jgi:N-acetylglutamate synthase-like GNAT family acetyltransferase
LVSREIIILSTITLLPYSLSFEQDCADIIAALPDWFGLPDANASYLENLNKLPSWVAVKDAKVIGIITLAKPFPGSFEIHFLAVHPDNHRQGIGKILMEHVEKEARRNQGNWLHVKTLSSSHPDPYYARTREFYFALGFSPLYETDTLWGPENPAMILIKAL